MSKKTFYFKHPTDDNYPIIPVDLTDNQSSPVVKIPIGKPDVLGYEWGGKSVTKAEAKSLAEQGEEVLTILDWKEFLLFLPATESEYLSSLSQ